MTESQKQWCCEVFDGVTSFLAVVVLFGSILLINHFHTDLLKFAQIGGGLGYIGIFFLVLAIVLTILKLISIQATPENKQQCFCTFKGRRARHK